jgi:AraC family ethanolamine operon transcriptional activator
MRDAFYKTVGMNPLAYLKAEQLNRVYRTLRHADPAETLIKQIAYENGFRHIGQFSQDYKHLFGELPSETLQRA